MFGLRRFNISTDVEILNYNQSRELKTVETLNIDENGYLPNGKNYIYLYLTRQITTRVEDPVTGKQENFLFKYPIVEVGNYATKVQVYDGLETFRNKYNKNFRDYWAYSHECDRNNYYSGGDSKLYDDDGTYLNNEGWLTYYNFPMYYKITFLPNPTYTSRTNEIHIESTYYGAINAATILDNIVLDAPKMHTSPIIVNTETCRLVILQEGKHKEILTPIPLRYKYTILDSYTKFLSGELSNAIDFTSPGSLNINTNYKSYETYLYIKSEGLNNIVTPLIYSNQEDSFTVEKLDYIYTKTENIDTRTKATYIECWKITISENTSNRVKNGVIKFYNTLNNLIFLIYVKLLRQLDGDTFIELNLLIDANLDVIYPSSYELDMHNPKKIICVDTNTGTVLDPESLLFKSDRINIYKTILQKDNTLFLGNYKTSDNINNIHNILYNNISLIKYKLDCYKNIMVKNDSSKKYYPEVPDMTLSSLDKHLFKKGEEYILGLVFVNDRGEKSSVLYLGDYIDLNIWTPSLEPHEEGNKYQKPIFLLAFTEDLSAKLRQLNIIGVIPVYVSYPSHKVICQGFANPTMYNSTRESIEGVGSQYSWFYRFRFPKSTGNDSLISIKYGKNLGFGGYEILSLQSDNNHSSVWQINLNVITVNSPDIEIEGLLLDSMLKGIKGNLIANYSQWTSYSDVQIKVNGSYSRSELDKTDLWGDSTNISLPCNFFFDTSGYMWKGFALPEGTKNNEILSKTGDDSNYGKYPLWVWQRNIPGAEGPEFTIKNKKWYVNTYAYTTKNTEGNLPSIVKAYTYYLDNGLSLLNLEGTAGIYQGNVDYIIKESNSKYPLWTHNSKNPHSETGTIYAGYDLDGFCQDPINMKYKTPNHIVLTLNDSFTIKDIETNGKGDITVIELYNPDISLDTSIANLKSYQWIQCGPMREIQKNSPTYISYEEGDYFYGRFDSYRTLPYAESDVNSVIEILSGKMCSRINLDSRTDRNRGSLTTNININNFNLFNPVYNLLNNYFTYYYTDVFDLIYDRSFKNSIQWSMTKTYGNDIDDWCNINDINTLDLDGDRGPVNALYKLGNNLLAFLDSGIALILYNEKTLLATDLGVPVEIANSGKVDGKYYLYNNIGCLNPQAITTSPTGLFFIDGINRNIYSITNQGELKDLTTTLGMNAWALKNLNTKWWSYYDSISQEVLFSNDLETLVYSDPYLNFRAFLGYGGIKHYFRVKDYTVQMLPRLFKQVLSLNLINGIDTIEEDTTIKEGVITLWKKNSLEESSFFGNNVPFEIEILCNPEHNQDKIFNNIEYRADSFSSDGTYIPEDTFTTLQVTTEYLDTGSVSLNWNTDTISNLSKKFRMWRILIPRNENTRDRIRNPWCKIKFTHNNKDILSKGIWKDITSSMSETEIANISKYINKPLQAKDLTVIALYNTDNSFIGVYKYSAPSRFIFYDMNISYMI